MNGRVVIFMFPFGVMQKTMWLMVATSEPRRKFGLTKIVVGDGYILHCQKGFLKWWEAERRKTNQKILPLPEIVNGDYEFAELKATVKVQNLLSLKTGDHEKLIYPYFSEEPPLSEATARMGLWLMSQALEGHSVKDMVILDVLRSKSYAISATPLKGDEAETFIENYKRILKKRRELRKEYPS